MKACNLCGRKVREDEPRLLSGACTMCNAARAERQLRPMTPANDHGRPMFEDADDRKRLAQVEEANELRIARLHARIKRQRKRQRQVKGARELFRKLLRRGLAEDIAKDRVTSRFTVRPEDLRKREKAA